MSAYEIVLQINGLLIAADTLIFELSKESAENRVKSKGFEGLMSTIDCLAEKSDLLLTKITEED